MAKGKATKDVVLDEHCAEVDVKAKQPRPLFDFKRQSFEKKLRIIGRCGINDVIVSAPLAAVGGFDFKTEGATFRCGSPSLSKSSLRRLAITLSSWRSSCLRIWRVRS